MKGEKGEIGTRGAQGERGPGVPADLIARIARLEESVTAARRQSPLLDARASSSRTAPRTSTMSHFADTGPVAQAATETRSGASSSSWAYWALPLAALTGLAWYYLTGDNSTRQVADAPPRFAATDAGPAARAPALSSTPAYLAKVSPDWVSIGTYYNRDVYNRAGEKLGTVNDFFIGPDGSIVASVLGVGGFLGIGEKEIAVPFAASQVARKDNSWHFVIDAAKEALQSAPAFQANSDHMRLSPPR
jgi:hypothetical protein